MGFTFSIRKILVQDKKSDRINGMNKIFLFSIIVNPKFTIGYITQPSCVYTFVIDMDVMYHVSLKDGFF